jgi:HNH endonuclease/AP2 domain
MSLPSSPAGKIPNFPNPMKEIPLTKGKVALVNDDDHEWLSRYKWYARHNPNGNWYAVRRTSRRADHSFVWMHRAIMGGPSQGFDIDHRNGNGLDNQRKNLRVATRSQNNANGKLHINNTSCVKGVSWDKARRKWAAEMRANYRTIHLGRFADKEEAIRVRRAAAQALFGEFAREESREPVQAEALINGC